MSATHYHVIIKMDATDYVIIDIAHLIECDLNEGWNTRTRLSVIWVSVTWESEG